jgi:hypothetical protein
MDGEHVALVPAVSHQHENVGCARLWHGQSKSAQEVCTVCQCAYLDLIVARDVEGDSSICEIEAICQWISCESRDISTILAESTGARTEEMLIHGIILVEVSQEQSTSIAFRVRRYVPADAGHEIISKKSRGRDVPCRCDVLLASVPDSSEVRIGQRWIDDDAR